MQIHEQPAPNSAGEVTMITVEDAALIFLLPLILSFVLSPLVIKFAHMIGAVDLPNERKIHQRPTPRLGGLAVFGSLFVALGVLHTSLMDRPPFTELPAVSSWLLGSLMLVFGLGIWDDIRALNPGRKFLVQLVAAAIVVASGVRIGTVSDPFGAGVFDLGVLSIPVTLIWIVGITNAFNLIDGLDGLASGIAVIAALTIGAIAYQVGDGRTIVLVLALSGALAGFLPYNFNPAKIFLGDSGSLVIGFTLAVASIQTSTKGTTAFAVVVPILALGLPIMDTMLSMARRVLHSLLPGVTSEGGLWGKLHGMFLPDKQHIHHRLIALGFSHRTVVLIMYAVSCVFGVGAFLVTMTNTYASLILIATALAMLAGIRHLRYKEMAILRNGVLLPLYEWPVMNRTIFQGFLDMGFCAIAYVIAVALTNAPTSSEERLVNVLPAVCGVQLAVFSLTGLYKGTFRYLGIGDVLKITKSVVLAVGAMAAVLPLLNAVPGAPDMTMVVTNFYLLLSCIVGSRVSYHILNYLFRRESGRGRRALIYGAGANGVITLQRILQEDMEDWQPLGFLDDDPNLEGKQINGFPIFGGHWKLSQLLKKHEIEGILIASDTLKPEILSRVKQTAQEAGVEVRRPKFQWENVPVKSLKVRHDLTNEIVATARIATSIDQR